LSDLTRTIVAEYNRQLRLIEILCTTLITVSLVGGTLSFAYLGASFADSIESTVIALTLGGGSLNAVGYSRAIIVGLSVAGILLTSLIVALITISVQKNASLRASSVIFQKERDLLRGEEKKKNKPEEPSST